MASYFETLRPSEKRLLVGIGAVVFVVLNLWFVVPHFSDWGMVKIRMAKAQKKLNQYEGKVRLVPSLQLRIKTYEGEGDVPLEDQSMHFQSAIQNAAIQTGVSIIGQGRIVTRTNNQFFLEQSQPVNLIAKEQQLVDFLYNLGAASSMIRVRDLALKPDAPRQQLSSTVKLVASYQKKQPTRASTTATAAPAAGTKKAVEPATRTSPTTIPQRPQPTQTNRSTTVPGGIPPAPGKTAPNPKKS